MKFFMECKTLDELKAKYKKLAMENHPDRGGNTETMQVINAEYAFASAKIIKGANLSEEDTAQQFSDSQIYREVIEKLTLIDGIVIELVGLWIWVTGNTYPVKKQLQDAGLYWAGQKKAWYYRPEELKGFRGSKKSLDDIKNKYGAEIIKSGYKSSNRLHS